MSEFSDPARLWRKPTQNPKDPEKWPAARRQKKAAETRLRNRIEEAEKLTPDHALRFLLAYAARIKYGENQYMETANLIRKMIQERRDLQNRVDELEKEVIRLTTPKPKRTRAYGTEGNGEWDIDMEGRDGNPQDYGDK